MTLREYTLEDLLIEKNKLAEMVKENKPGCEIANQLFRILRLCHEDLCIVSGWIWMFDDKEYSDRYEFYIIPGECDGLSEDYYDGCGESMPEAIIKAIESYKDALDAEEEERDSAISERIESVEKDIRG